MPLSKFPLVPDDKHIKLEAGLWKVCKKCGEKIFIKTFKRNNFVCPKCEFYYPITPDDRFKMLFDDAKYTVFKDLDIKEDPLKFSDTKPYKERIKVYEGLTGYKDAAIGATGSINEQKAVIWVLNFDFMGGSMGRYVGESFLQAVDYSVKHKIPFIAVTASGGARMQEGILSLMQMARTTLGVKKLKDAGIPYIVLLTNPTTGGVSASFAMLGDITLAEKGAEIGFAGKRVIENTIKQQLPDDFQTAEYLKEHGFVDIVITRDKLKNVLSLILSNLKGRE